MDWINKINVVKPSQTDKMRMLRYYLGEECACGGKKKGYRWDCLNCLNKRNLSIAQNLEIGCANHISWAVELLKDHAARA